MIDVTTFLMIMGGILFFLFLLLFISPPEPVLPPPSPKPVEFSPQEFLIRQTYIRAISGDRHARDWITKYFLEEQNRPKKQSHNQKSNKKTSQQTKKTSEAIVNDAILALRSLGFTNKNAADKVRQFTSKKYYSHTEELVKDVFAK